MLIWFAGSYTIGGEGGYSGLGGSEVYAGSGFNRGGGNIGGECNFLQENKTQQFFRVFYNFCLKEFKVKTRCVKTVE